MHPSDFGLDIITWHVAFGDFHKRDRRWWHPFCEPGFSHVLAFGYVRGGWVVIDPLVGHIDVRVAIGSETDLLIGALKVAGGRILRCDRVIRHSWRPRGPVYCVTVVKHLLGVRGFAVTPRQLHDALIAQGAVEVFQ